RSYGGLLCASPNAIAFEIQFPKCFSRSDPSPIRTFELSEHERDARTQSSKLSSGQPPDPPYPILLLEGRVYSKRMEAILGGASIPHNRTNKRGKSMKKLLLIALVASGLAFVPAQRSDAQVYVGVPGTGIGVGVGFGYPSYGYYYGYPRYYGYY